MNAPFLVAQNTALPSSVSPTPPARVIKLSKPSTDQAVTVALDGSTQIDFSAIGSENVTFVRVGNQLVILFDNASTITVGPFFDADGRPFSDIQFHLADDRLLNGTEFASLFPISTDQSILPAAGNGAGAQGGGGDFSSATVEQFGASGQGLGLLGGTDGTGAAFGAVQTGNTQPVIGTPATSLLDEDGLSEGNLGGPGDVPGAAITFTGSLGVDFGQQFVGRSLAFTDAQPEFANLTSSGQAISFVITTLNGQPELIAFVGNNPNIAANVVFTITLDASSLDGTYTITLLRPLDHLIAGTEDSLTLPIGFIARDGDGDAVTGTFSVTINDDSPVILSPDATGVTEAAVNGVLTPVTVSGSLAINFGADNFDEGQGTVLNGIDRSVSFSGTNSTGLVLTETGAALTSNGQTISIVVIDATHISGVSADGRTVFTVTIDDGSAPGDHGIYTFTLNDNLDHVGGGQGAVLGLIFGFTAKDADGDTVSSTFTVTVTDDLGVPAIGTIGDHTLVEQTRPEASEQPVFHNANFNSGLTVVIVSPPDYSDNTFVSSTTGPVSLNVDWGSDDNNPTAGAGTYDRSVAFTTGTLTALISLGLTSDGATIGYTLSADHQTLTATAGGGGSPVRTIFTVQLSDSGNGTYTFRLLDNLDHVAGNGRNDQPLTFSFTATDSDGDTTSPASFTVHVTDDVPVIPGAIPSLGGFPLSIVIGIDEANLPGGNGDGTPTTATGDLGVDWNSDDYNPTPGAGPHDRSVALTAATLTDLAALNLTSNGAALSYTLSADGQTLTATADLGGGRTVFTVHLSDSGNGTYTFTLADNLDHPAGNGANDIDLTFGYTATDADGDTTAPAHFTFTVTDDTPVQAATTNASIDEESLPGGNAGDSYASGDLNPNPGAATANGFAVTGDLGISWGADRDLKAEHLDAGAIGAVDDPIGRTASFVTASGDGTVLAVGVVTATQLGLPSLTSDGVALAYRIDYAQPTNGIWNGGYVLTAYKASGSATTLSDQVFKVTLDPTSEHGGYTFEQLGNLDHAGANSEDDINLTFRFRAADADADFATAATFTVTVDDDAPVLGTVHADASTLSVTTDLFGQDGNAIGSGGLPGTPRDHIVSGSIDGLPGNYYVYKVAFGAPFTGVPQITLPATGSNSLDHFNLSAHNITTTGFEIWVYRTDAGNVGGNYGFSVDDVTYTATYADAIGRVDEEGLNPNDLNTDRGESGDIVGKALITHGTLGVSWGSDDNNGVVDGGRGASQVNGDRAVVFASDATSTLLAQDLHSNGASLQYDVTGNGATLTAYRGAGRATTDKVFTVSLSDQNTGAYTFTLQGPLDHPAGQGENNVALSFRFTAYDGDGDGQSGAFEVDVNDDAPIVSATVVTLASVDEDDLATGNDTLPRETLVSTGTLGVSWGADNDTRTSGDTVGRTLTIVGGTALPQGLTSDGVAIVYGSVTMLANGGQSVTAYKGTAVAGNEVFTLTLDPTSTNGSATFTLQGNLDHAAGGGETAKTLTFQYQATDADGDTASQTGSFKIDVADDIPVFTAAVAGQSVDEEGLTGGNAGDTYAGNSNGGTAADLAGEAKTATATLNIAWGSDDANSNVDGGFSGTQVNGDRSVVFASNAITALQAQNFKSDNIALQYEVTDSGKTLTAYQGSTHDSAHTVFTVTLSDQNTGSYNFTLSGHLDHPTANTEDNLTPVFNFIARDGDGDAISSTFSVTVNDDAPVAKTITNATVLDDDAFDGNPGGVSGDVTDATVASGTAGALFTAGADGFKSVTLGTTTSFSAMYVDNSERGKQESVTVGAAVVSNGTTTWTFSSADIATVATLAIKADGSYTFTTFAPLVHPTAGSREENLALTFNYTITDGDNDTAMGSLTVNVNDDAPVGNRPPAATGFVDEENLAAAATLVAADSLGFTFGADGKFATVTAGSSVIDGALTFTDHAIAANDVVVRDSNGNNVTSSLTSNGLAVSYKLIDAVTLVGYTGAAPAAITDSNVVFSVVLSSATISGRYTFTQNASLDHPTANTEDNLVFTFNITAKDGDGDTLASTIVVTVNDDSPVVSATIATLASVDEDDLPNGNDTLPRESLVTTGALGVSWGADNDTRAPGETFGRTLAIVSGTLPSGLTSDGVAIVYGSVTPLANGGQSVTAYKGSAGAGNEVFTLTLDPTSTNGSATFTLQGHLDHAPGGGETAKTLTFQYQATDADGDTAAQTGSFTVDVVDDVPVVSATARQNLEEAASAHTLTNIALAVSWGADDGNAGTADRSSQFASTPATAQDPSGAATSLSSNGNAILFTTINGTLVGYTGATAPTVLTAASIVFTVSLSDTGTGSYSFDLRGPLDHPAPVGGNQFLDLVFSYTATDADGDTSATATFAVRVDAAGAITGAAHDTLDYSGLTSPLAVDFDANTAVGAQIGHDAIGTVIVNAIGGTGGDTFTYVVGDGHSMIDGGAGSDVLNVTGTSAAETYNINAITLNGETYLGVNIESGANNNVAATATNYEVATKAVEDIFITANGGNDTVNITGSLNGTGVAQSTIHVDTGAGNDTLDISGRTSPHRVVADGGADTDTVKLDFNRADIAYGTTTNIYAEDGTTLIGVDLTHTIGGVTVVDEFRNFESFVFKNGSTTTLGGIANQPPVITSTPQTGSVTEDASFALGGNIVANASFENDGFNGVAPWNTDGADGYGGPDAGPHSGDYSAAFGFASSSMTLSQTLTTGTGTYTLDFWAEYLNYGSSDNSLVVSWNGMTIGTLTNVDSALGYQHYTFTFAGSGGNGALLLTMNASGGFFELDDFSARTVASPTPGTETSAGHITFTDIDNATHTISVGTAPAGYYGTFNAILSPDSNHGTGTVNWTYSVADSDIQFLHDGQILTQTYAVTITDGNASTTENVTVTLHGVNDAAETNNTTATGNEDAASIAISLSGSDVDGTVTSFKIVALAANGTLYSDAALTHEIAAGDLVAATANAATVYFKPDPNWHGDATLQYAANDDFGSTDASAATATITVNSVSEAPEGADKTLTINGDKARVLTVADFGFHNPADGDTFTGVTISSLPVHGVLTDNLGVGIAQGAVISAADIAAGHLLYTPVTGETGTGYASFTFQVHDDGLTDNGGINVDPTPNTLAFDVTAPNETPVIVAPIAVAGSVTEDDSYILNTNLLANGGFESHTGPDFTNWTIVAPAGSNYNNSGSHHSGAIAAIFSTANAGGQHITLSQDVQTHAGVTYAIDFFALNAFGSGNSLSVIWNGQSVEALANVPGTGSYGGPFTEYTIYVSGVEGTSHLTFDMTNGQYWVIDDASVSVAKTPGTEITKGIISFTDADVADTHANPTVTALGTGYLGTFSAVLKADSTNGQTGAVEWTFSVNDSDPAVQALGVHDTLTQNYRVTISDGDVNNGAVTQDVTVTIHGTNDAPTLEFNFGTTVVTEDQDDSGYLLLQAAYTPTDVDGDLSFSGSGFLLNTTTTGGAVVSAALLAALQSGFVADAGYQANYGAYAETYLFLDNSIVQYLGTGQSVTANYRFTVSDGNGGLTDQLVTYTILGKDEVGNAVPTITSPLWTVGVTEDASKSAVPSELIGNGGFENGFTNWTLTIPTEGYAARAGNAKFGGATAIFENYYGTLPVQMSQDVATVAGQHYTLSYWLYNAYGANNQFTATWNGNVIQAITNQQGSTNYNVSNFVQYTFDVVGDSDGVSTLHFDFANKAGYWFLDGVSVQGAITSGTEARSGLISFSDANIADTHTVGFTPVGTGYVGTFNASVTNPSTGDGAGIVTWNFVASDADLQYLAAGQTVKQYYDVTISDNFSPTHGTVTQRVEVDLVGVNDAPTDIVFRDVANAVVDPASGTTTLTILKTAATGADVGNAHGVDPDTSDVLTYAFWNGTTASQTSTDGIFTINSATGAITVASATLLAAQSGSHSYTIQVTDQGGAGVSYNEGLTIAVGTPVNHDPVAVNDDLNFATGPQANPPANLTGWVFNNANGHYYKIVTTALPFAQAEAAAEAAGGHLATITSAAENTFIRGLMSSGQALLIGASDSETEGVWKWVYGPEAGTVFWSGAANGSVVAGGYAPWNTGEPNDSGGNEDVATIQFSTSGWNDIPATLASGYVMEWSSPAAEQKGVLENASKTFSTSLLFANDSDPDGDLVSFFGVQATSAKGATITYDAGTGQVTYNAATSSQLAALTYGQSTTDTFTYTVTDTHGATSTATATITVAGKNDAPAVGAPGVGQVTEDFDLTAVQGERVTNGKFENGTTGFTIANINPAYSGLVTAGGSTAYSIYTVGTTVPATLTQTLATTAGVTYDVSLSIANNNSSNNGITVYWNGVAYLAFANIPMTGSYDIFTQYTFQAVAASSSTTFQIAAFSPSASVTFDNISVHAATSETASGVITFTDAELADSHTVSASAHAMGYVGNFTANITDLATGDGFGKVTWLFNVENSQIQNLGQGQSVQQVYTVAISDSHGNTTSQDVTVTINGTNDAPVLGNDTVKLGGYTIDAFPATVGSTPILAEVENNSSSSPQDISRSLFKVATNANLGDSTLPSITITGSIGSNSDKDFFKIFLKQGETIVLDVDNTTGGLDTYLLLRPSPTGSSLTFNDDWTNGGSGSGSSGHPTDSYLSYTATSSATYYIDLESFNSSSKGNYQLQVSIGNFTPDASGTNRIAVSDLLANDSDKDSNDHLTITGVTGTGVALVDNNTSIEVQAGVTSFTYTATDGHVSQTATVAVQALNTGTTIAGTAADEVLVGSASADTINGGAGKDILYGGGSNDILNGGSENDILVGGLGNDTLTGGTGADTFRFAETGAANRDIITDYHFNEGDKIDLSALLDANFGSGSAVSDFVRLTPSGGDVVVQVDVDGAGTANTWADVATLQGYNTIGNQVLLQFEQQAHQLAVA